MAKDVKVIEDAPVEVLASAIVKISEAAQKMQASGLTRRALVLLIHDISKVGIPAINDVLDALPILSRRYVSKPGAR
jgi:hypothetical protein